jgi:hypothetical protein
MKGVAISTVPIHRDERGALLALDALQSLPFELRRCFFIWGCPASASRAGHSVSAPMALVALRGNVTIDFDTGSEQLTLELSKPDRLVCIEAGVWLRMRNFSADALVAVASSSYYTDTRYSDLPQPDLLSSTS